MKKIRYLYYMGIFRICEFIMMYTIPNKKWKSSYKLLQIRKGLLPKIRKYK